jgi:hypothetical protein
MAAFWRMVTSDEAAEAETADVRASLKRDLH